MYVSMIPDAVMTPTSQFVHLCIKTLF